MLSIHSARQRSHNGKIGLAIAGGGPIGGMYELGALRALDEALDGLDLTRMDCYVGVSFGAFLAAGLANRMGTAEMCRIFITGTSDDAEFRPETFLRPNVGEYLRRAASLPGLYADWLARLMRNPRRATRWSDLFLRFGGLVPTGIFDNEEVERFLRDIFSRRGRSNDFRTLEADLYVVAVDLFLNDLNQGADVIFPALGFAEKEGTVTNVEGRVQKVNAVLPGPGQSRPDWSILADIADRVGRPVSLSSLEAIAKEIAAVAPAYRDVTWDLLEWDERDGVVVPHGSAPSFTHIPVALTGPPRDRGAARDAAADAQQRFAQRHQLAPPGVLDMRRLRLEVDRHSKPACVD